MLRLSAVAFSVALIAGACRSATGPGLTTADVSGMYVLGEIDGHALPYSFETEPDGSDLMLGISKLALRPDSSYEWMERWGRFYAASDCTWVMPESIASAGRYSVSGATVVLRDSVSGARLGASVGAHDTLRLEEQGRRYAFWKAPPASPEGKVYWFSGCEDSVAWDDDCPVQTVAGAAPFRQVGGDLYVGSDSMSWLVPTSPARGVGANQYGWVHQSEVYDTSGDSTLVTAVEIGSYTWDGTTFKTEPDDTSKFSPGAGTLNGMVLQLHQGGLDYAFVEVPFLPGTLGARGPGRAMRVVPGRSEPGTGPPRAGRGSSYHYQ